MQPVRGWLAAHLDARIVDELLAAYNEAKRNYYLGGLRLSAVEAGRFCEAACRVLERRAFGAYEPLGRRIDVDQVARRLANTAAGALPDSLRLHVPRAIRVVYDIRNNRDAAHLADGIDPNMQDATLVVSVLDWILAEFVRVFHGVTPAEAQAAINKIVTRAAPVIEDFDGFLKVLRVDLAASDHILLLLYHRGHTGASVDDLTRWARPPMRDNLRRTLRQLDEDKSFIHRDGAMYRITRTGILCVEERRLFEMA
jgi:hypothetical protein